MSLLGRSDERKSLEGEEDSSLVHIPFLGSNRKQQSNFCRSFLEGMRRHYYIVNSLNPKAFYLELLWP